MIPPESEILKSEKNPTALLRRLYLRSWATADDDDAEEPGSPHEGARGAEVGWDVKLRFKVSKWKWGLGHRV